MIVALAKFISDYTNLARSLNSNGRRRQQRTADVDAELGRTSAEDMVWRADGKLSRTRSMACQQEDKWDSPNYTTSS